MAGANGRPENQRQWVLQALSQFEAPLMRFAMRLLHGDAHKAHDAVQHTFLMLCQQRAETLDERLAPWLYRVCRNKIVDEIRIGSRMTDRDEPWEQIVDTRTEELSGRLEKSEFDSMLERIVDRLPAGQHEAFQLWRDGLGFSEIATAVEKTEGAIRVLVHRAIVSIRNHSSLAKWMDDSELPRVSKSKIVT